MQTIVKFFVIRLYILLAADLQACSGFVCLQTREHRFHIFIFRGRLCHSKTRSLYSALNAPLCDSAAFYKVRRKSAIWHFMRDKTVTKDQSSASVWARDGYPFGRDEAMTKSEWIWIQAKKKNPSNFTTHCQNKKGTPLRVILLISHISQRSIPLNIILENPLNLLVRSQQSCLLMWRCVDIVVMDVVCVVVMLDRWSYRNRRVMLIMKHLIYLFESFKKN